MGTATNVLAILAGAEANEWTTIQELKGRCGVPRREIEDAVQELRLAGHPIIASAEGLRYTLDASEIRDYAQGRRRRLVSIALGTRALLRAARRLDTDQPSLGL